MSGHPYVTPVTADGEPLPPMREVTHEQPIEWISITSDMAGFRPDPDLKEQA